jgi:hypothetical protein
VGHAADRRHRRRLLASAARLARRPRRDHRHRDRRAHPDIAPNFDAQLSRNFTVDDRTIDGAVRPIRTSPARTRPNVDETATARTSPARSARRSTASASAASPPKVDLVNLRAGQDSGYFFLGPTLDALTYAGDNGIDVVNMSYYIDPWLYNCAANPADSPAEQREQRLIISATQRAIDYARAGRDARSRPRATRHTDLGNPDRDDTSPDYPDGGVAAPSRHRTTVPVDADRGHRRDRA